MNMTGGNAMQTYIVSYLFKNRDTLMKRWEIELDKVRQEDYLDSISESVYKNTNQQFMQFIFESLESSQEEANERLTTYTDRYVQNGWPLGYFTKGLQAFRRVIL